MTLSRLATTERIVLALALVNVLACVALLVQAHHTKTLADQCAALTYENEFLKKQNTMLHAALTKANNGIVVLTMGGGE